LYLTRRLPKKTGPDEDMRQAASTDGLFDSGVRQVGACFRTQYRQEDDFCMAIDTYEKFSKGLGSVSCGGRIKKMASTVILG